MVEAESDWLRVCREETARIRRRRATLPEWLKCTCRIPPNTVGLALSGGGIRSATFSLGLMKSLSKQRLIHSIDYLSTVSGGGYAGAFFCSLFVPNHLRGPAPPPKDSEDMDGEGNEASKRPSVQAADVADGAECDILGTQAGRDAIAQLRQGGHYLAPNGTSDALFAGVIAIRNWFAMAITTGLGLLALFFFINFFTAALSNPAASMAEMFTGYTMPVGRYSIWAIIMFLLAFWPASCAWAYWFARSGNVPLSRSLRLFSIQSLVAFLILILALVWPARRGGWEAGWHEPLRYSIAALALLSFVLYALAEFVSFWRDQRLGVKRSARNAVEALAEEDRVRNRLSRWLLRGIIVFAIAAALAVIHWASREQVFRGGKFVGIDPVTLALSAVAAAGLLLATRWALVLASTGFRRQGRASFFTPRLRQFLSLLFGTLLLLAFVMFWATMAGGASEWIEANAGKAWRNLQSNQDWLNLSWFVDIANNLILEPLDIKIGSADSATPLLFLISVKVGLIAYLMGNVDSLLNRSSFSTFYSGRLRSAYLGATNQRRRLRDVPLDHDDPNDEITLSAYYKRVLAPIHLINVTINETTNRSSRVIQRDRKGKPMVVAPSGYLYPPGSPSDLAILHRNDAEDLPLSSWMAISGAAFTTGAGHHTTLGTAILATMTNMRLGYWWNSASPTKTWPLRRPSRLVQAYLLRELRASYEGTCASRWYLSDGGHYENTGIYELIRRRIPFVIASDNGADPYYEFADLVNLIRKARIDFGAEIEFLDDSELDAIFLDAPLRDVFGSLDEIRQSGKQASKAAADPTKGQPKAGPYATLARILYPAGGHEQASTGTLLLIKPRITGRELPDLVQYRDMNAAFPQQPTTNQFFDEAQWESYYRLGQLIGDMIFKKDRFPEEATHVGWQPWKLEPLAS